MNTIKHDSNDSHRLEGSLSQRSLIVPPIDNIASMRDISAIINTSPNINDESPEWHRRDLNEEGSN